MKEKLQLIYDEFVKSKPEHGPDFHKWNLAWCHLRALLIAHGGEDETMKRNRLQREAMERFRRGLRV